MVACHTGIYVGLTGAVNAPHTWEAYSTVNFWSHIMSKWESDIPKTYPKSFLRPFILYSGLNETVLASGGRGPYEPRLRKRAVT